MNQMTAVSFPKAVPRLLLGRFFEFGFGLSGNVSVRQERMDGLGEKGGTLPVDAAVCR